MAQLKGLRINDTGSLKLPAGTSVQRPSNINTVQSFTTVGTTSWTAPAGVTQIEVLVVGGGGSGGRPYGGGGGGGGIVYNSAYPVTPNTSYIVTVGAGGAALAASLSLATVGNDGGDSVFDSLVAKGGGGGGCWGVSGTTGGDTATAGRNGGSGGGGGARNSSPTFNQSGQLGGLSLFGQGNSGGTGRQFLNGGSGGGGGAGAGGQTSFLSDIGGQGGDGILYSVTGTPTYYGAGGGGGVGNSTGTYRPSPGGKRGGGDGGYSVSTTANSGLDGTANTGGGGGGASGTAQGSTANTAGASGGGGSGIVILRYSVADSVTDAISQTRFNTTSNSIEYFDKGIFNTNVVKKDIVVNGLVCHVDAANYASGSTTVIDQTSNAFVGTLRNGVSYDAADGGGTFVFDGVDDYIDFNTNLTDASLLGIGDVPFSLEAWFKVTNDSSLGPTVLTNDAGILGITGSSAGGYGFQIFKDSQGLKINFMARNTSNYTHPIPFRLNEWIHVVCTRDRGNGTNSYIYINGRPYRSETGDLSILSFTGNLSLGYNGPRQPLYFAGKIAVARVYNRSLTSTEVNKNFQAELERFNSYVPYNSGETGNPGGGFSVAQGADAENITNFTENGMLQYKRNDDNQGANTAGTALSYSLGYAGSGNFSYHTGHNGFWWPMYHAIKVSTSPYGKVLNQIEWQYHTNAIGNVDIFGSNRNITSENFDDDGLYTWLGRVHFGGFSSGGSDGNVRSGTFNTQNLGFRWYLIKGIDNGSSVAYPNVGSTTGGWAMYRLRLNKI